METGKSVKDTSFLATAPVGRLFFKMAIPTITAQIINMLYNLVDRMYIGRIPDVGALALTGVGVCLPIIFIITSFSALIGYGGAPRASIFLGKGDRTNAERVLGNSFSTLAATAIILTIFFSIFGEQLLFLFGASSETIEYASGYLSIYTLGTIFVQMSLGLNAYITAQGHTKISMITVVIGAVANIILDPIFIFGLNMGVEGAAVATVISQGLSATFVIGFLLSKHSSLKIRLKHMMPSLKVMMPSLALGFSPFIMQITESLTIISFNSSLLKYGGDLAVGAMTIGSSAMQLAFLPLQGFAQGAQPITGYNLGAGNLDRVRKVFKTLLVSSLVFSITLWIVMMTLPQIFAMIFTADTELIEYTRFYLRIYMAGAFSFGVQMPCQMTFVALGCAKQSAIAAINRKIILLIPLVFILPNFFNDKVMAVFLAEPIADVLAATTTALIFRYTFKRVLKKREDELLKAQ